MKIEHNNGARGTQAARGYRGAIRLEQDTQSIYGATGQTACVGRVLVGEEKPAPRGATAGETAYQARQKRLDRDHPFARLASFVAWRVMNPGLSRKQRAASPVIAKGKGKRARVKGYAQAVAFAGHDARRLSATDRAEVIGAVALAALAAPTDPRSIVHALGLAYRGEVPPHTADGKQWISPALMPAARAACVPCRVACGVHRFGFGEWKQIFTAARATLGIKRGTRRGTFHVESLESLTERAANGEGADVIGQAALAAEIERQRVEAAAESADTLRRAVLAKARTLAQAIKRSRDVEKAAGARKWRSNWRGALAHLGAAFRATCGGGHGHNRTRTAAYERAATFREYLAVGERARAGTIPALAALRLDAVCE